MPPKLTGTFDASQMKLHLNKYVTEISDMLTSPQDIERYADFTQSVIKLNGLTAMFYQMNEDGTYPLLTEEDKKLLTDAYQDAMEQAAKIVNGNETGAVGEQMRSIAGVLLPMMHADHAALEITDVSRAPFTLPALIGNARAQAVDMGDQQTEIESGMMSSRRHIKVQNGTTVEEGFFTASSHVNIEKRYFAHLDKMAAKYPDYKPLIDAFRAAKLEDVFSPLTAYRIYSGCEENDFDDDLRSAVLGNCRDDIFEPVDIPENLYAPLEQRDDYLKFMDEFSSGMQPIKPDYTAYRHGNMIEADEGANIDRRNTAMSRMGKLLGKPGLVAEARPMILIQNGQAVAGTFMKKADGVDVSKVGPRDAFRQFTTENFDNPEAFSDIAAMQALDFICGNADRHPGNFFLLFDSDPRTNPDAKLTGLQLIDNDLSFSKGPAEHMRESKCVFPEEMGVIGRDTYNAIKSMTKEQMQFVLADCGLSQAEIDQAWNRKEALQKKIEEDQKVFQNKPAGELVEKCIRIVPENEWSAYHINKIAEKFHRSQFRIVLEDASVPKRNENAMQQMKDAKEKEKEIRRRVLNLEPEPEPAPQPQRPIPVGKVIGSGIAQEADPLNVAREETVKLVVPDLAKVKPVGGAVSQRYPVSYRTEQGEQQAFFTGKAEQTAAFRIKRLFDQAVQDHPKYADDLRRIQRYCNITDRDLEAAENSLNSLQPLLSPVPDYTAVNIPKERADQLAQDEEFVHLSKSVIAKVMLTATQRQFYLNNGIASGQRLETRNVAMSDISELLGVPDLIAKSTTAQIMSGGTIIDGVLINKAEGVDIKNIGDGHPMKQISLKQASAVYNQPEALKKLADLQVLDYICMNDDRHIQNMTYQFEGLGTKEPKFKGVQGFDNDTSFGSKAPDPTRISVISEQMAEKLNEPDLSEKITEKLKKNGLSEAEIDAAKQRLEKIKAAVNSGKVKTVKDDEWGKKEQKTRIEDLSADRGSIFHFILSGVIVPFADAAKKWAGKPEAERIEQPKEELKYCKALRVGSFGLNAQEQKQLDELQREAEKEFAAAMEETVQQAKFHDGMTMKEYLQTLKNTTKRIYNDLDAANPVFHSVPKEYKDLVKASEELRDLSSKLQKNLGSSDRLDPDNTYKLLKAVNKLSNCSAAYLAKKQREIEEGREPSPVDRKGMAAAETASYSAKVLKQEFRKALSLAQAQKSSPLTHIHTGIKNAQRMMNDAAGEKLRDLVASQIYYRALEGSSITVKNSGILLNAINPDVMDKSVEQIKQSPAFQALAAMKDDQLRLLAQDGDGGKLMDRFFLEAAKSKKANAAQQPNQNAAEAARNMDIPNMGKN